MDLLKLMIVASCLSMTFSGHANSMDACSQLVGHWDGFFTIKEPTICENFGGCTHNIKVNVTYPPTDWDAPVFYEALVSPYAGIGGAFEIACEHNVIRCANCPVGLIVVSCDKSTTCEVSYDGPLLLSKMTKIS